MKKFLRGNVFAVLSAALISAFIPGFAFDAQAAVSYDEYLQVQIGDSKKGMRLYTDGLYETTVNVPSDAETYQILSDDEVIKEESIDTDGQSKKVIIRYYSKDDKVVTSLDESLDSNGNLVQGVKKVANWTGNFFNAKKVEEFKQFGSWDQSYGNTYSRLNYVGGGIFNREFVYTIPQADSKYAYKINFDGAWNNGEIGDNGGNMYVTFPGGEGTDKFFLWADSVNQTTFNSINDDQTVFRLASEESECGEEYSVPAGLADVDLVLKRGDESHSFEMIQTSKDSYMVTVFVKPGFYSWNDSIDGNKGALKGTFTVDKESAVTFYYSVAPDDYAMRNTVVNPNLYYGDETEDEEQPEDEQYDDGYIVESNKVLQLDLSAGETVVDDGPYDVKILMIGNSLTRYNDVASKVKYLFEYAGVKAKVDVKAQMSASLSDHATVAARTYEDMIINGGYDYVILQDKSSGFTEELLVEGVAGFIPWFEKSSSKMLLYMPWANEDVFESMQDTFTSAYKNVAAEYDALLAPSGVAYYDLYFNHDKHWYRKGDNVHGNDLASLISASSIFYAINNPDKPLEFSEDDMSVIKKLVESDEYRNYIVDYDASTVNLIQKTAYKYANKYNDRKKAEPEKKPEKDSEKEPEAKPVESKNSNKAVEINHSSSTSPIPKNDVPSSVSNGATETNQPTVAAGTTETVQITEPKTPTKGPKKTSKNAVAVGTKFTSGGLSFKVTKASKNAFEVQVLKSTKKTLKKLTIPGTVKYNKQTFKVTSVGANAFKNNSKLKTVTIGKNVKFVGKKAFYGCKKLKTVSMNGSKAKTIGTDAFSDTSDNIVFTVNKKTVDDYKESLKGNAPSKYKVKKVK